MDELEILRKQRDEINKRINEIRFSNVSFGCASLVYDSFNYKNWKIKIDPDSEEYTERSERLIELGYKTKAKNRVSIGDRKTRKEAIEIIPKIVNDLTGLYEKLKDEEQKYG